jgi:hypothetical protein
MRAHTHRTSATLPLIVAALCLACSTGRSYEATPSAAVAKVYEIRNGAWFSGAGFGRRTMYVSAGRFIAAPTAPPDSVLDLAGAFVVPPFAEGHNHWLEPAGVQAYIQSYLRDGVFYVKDQGNAPYIRARIDSALNKETSVDFISANQGWTGPGGHPLQIAGQFVAMGVFPRAWADSIDQNVVMVVSDSSDIAARWPIFLAGKPAFAKVFLVHSEEYERRRADSVFMYRRGIDPRLVPEIVRRAHLAGLRVSAHIYSAGDFRNALRGGVDDIAHFPGTGLAAEPDLPLASYIISDADAREAARRGVSVTTTLSWLGEVTDTARRSVFLRDVVRPNLELLRKHDVRLLIGSDQFRQTSSAEAALLVQLGLFTPLEALRTWSIATPQAIFPNRRIGTFTNGAEASFLALAGDPIADFRNVQRINLRMKQGVILRVPDTAPQFPRLP